jgi:hypothetical protein
VPRRQIGLHTIDALISGPAQTRPSAYAITVRTQLVVRESS